MATLSIPNIEDNPPFDAQANWESTVLAIIMAGVGGTGVLSGCAVSFASGLSVAVAVGQVQQAGGSVPIGVAAAVVNVAAPSTFGDRRDLVTVDGNGVAHCSADTPALMGAQCGVVGWTRNTPSAPPRLPPVPSGQIAVGAVYVPGQASALTVGGVQSLGVTLLASTPAPTTAHNPGTGVALTHGVATRVLAANATRIAYTIGNDSGAEIIYGTLTTSAGGVPAVAPAPGIGFRVNPNGGSWPPENFDTAWKGEVWCTCTNLAVGTATALVVEI